MNGRDALMLVRAKFTEEMKGIKASKTAEAYATACDEYPAQMQIAHIIFANELSKTLP